MSFWSIEGQGQVERAFLPSSPFSGKLITKAFSARGRIELSSKQARNQAMKWGSSVPFFKPPHCSYIHLLEDMLVEMPELLTRHKLPFHTSPHVSILSLPLAWAIDFGNKKKGCPFTPEPWHQHIGSCVTLLG